MVAATRKKSAAPQEGGTVKEANPRKTCKTCSSCRLKKVRCCGTQPRCAECISDELDCVYLRDARREPRPSRAHVNRLENTLSTMLKHMKSAGLSPVDMNTEEWIQTWCSGSLSPVVEKEEHQLESTRSRQPHEITINIDALGFSDPGSLPQQGILVPSSVSFDCRKDSLSPKEAVSITGNPADKSLSPGLEMVNLGAVEENVVGSSHSDYMQSTLSPLTMNAAPDKDNGHHHSSPGSVGSGVGRTPHRQLSSIDDRDRLSELSMGEAHVAGISHQDGCVSSVHGLTSVMNSTSGAKERGFLMTNKTQNHHARAAIKDRLMSYAALQSQRETWVYNQPDIHIDLDGCDVDLAKHLIDLHFNIQHYTYLISYRPAIIDSLASGGGPWCNKLLLNAIYYSSSLFSDRPCFREDPKGPKNIGSQFYNRFYQLLGPEIVRPSIPSAVGLLLMSASLVSHGRASAGWNLSGIAYRMVIDLGCHLTLGPGHQRFQSTSPVRSSEGALNQDLEQEMRKRLYWGAFATDATQSLYLGRPCMLAPIEARVPFEFLDTFEELEKWEPYMDHDPQTVHLNPPTYAPQPAHAVSTFSAVARLLQISTRIGKLYGIGAIKCSSTDIQCDLVEIEKELQEWSSSLPGHLHFDVETCQRQAPPPHKINPHTTFHALNILLHRAFLEDGHLYHHSDSNITTRSEEACLHSALLIENFLRALRDTFTLRGGPFLLCYATYSAVSIVLRAERHNRGRYLESISFFWTCLSEMQRGCNFGMTKPLAILKEMVREYNISIRQNGISMDARNSDSDIILTQEGLDQSFFELTPPPLMTLDDSSTMPLTAGDYVSDLHDFQAAHSGDDWLGDGSASNFATYLDEQEQQLWRDTLYGLFTSTLPFG